MFGDNEEKTPRSVQHETRPAIAYRFPEDLEMSAGIGPFFTTRFRREETLSYLQLKVGKVLILTKPLLSLFYLFVKERPNSKTTFWAMWDTPRTAGYIKKLQKLAIPRIGSRLNQLERRIIRIIIEKIFQDINMEAVICSFNTQGNQCPRKQVTWYFLSKIGCNKVIFCNFRYDISKLTQIDPGFRNEIAYSIM